MDNHIHQVLIKLHWGSPVSNVNIMLTTIMLRNILYSHSELKGLWCVERRELVTPSGSRVLFI